MTEESRAKISAANKRNGRRPPSRKGIPHTEEHKRYMSEKMKGRKFSEETLAKRRASARRGADHHFWRGGVTPEHIALRMSTDYRRWREAVFARDDYTCRECGDRGGRLNAHHSKRFADHPESRFDTDNGVTLCVPCHRKTDNFGRWPKPA